MAKSIISIFLTSLCTPFIFLFFTLSQNPCYRQRFASLFSKPYFPYCHFRRYSRGVIRYLVLNARLKYDRLSNPHCSEMDNTVSSVVRSASAAAFNRYSLRKAVNLCPVIFLNHRIKWLELHWQMLAASATCSFVP